VIQNNTLLRNAYQGIEVSGANGGSNPIQILNNTMDGNRDSGIQIDGDHVLAAITIKDNIAKNSAAAGIQIYSANSNTLVQNNDVTSDSGGSQPQGIFVRALSGSTVQGLQILSNTVHSQSQDGISVESDGGTLNSITISSNSIFNIARYGLVINENGHTGSIAGVSISGNCLASVGGGSLYDDRAGPAAPPAISQSCASNTTADSTPPTASLTSPTNGQTVSGTVTVKASATDNIGVAGVQFQLNGAAMGGEVTAAPYNYMWDTRTLSNGSYAISAVARDSAGNRTTSQAVYVTVSNADTTAPTVQITNPANGVTVSGTINVSATASDNIGVAGVQFQLDGAALGSEVSSAPFQVAWNTSNATAGSHQLTATARDAAGNRTSATVTVSVSRGTPCRLPSRSRRPPVTRRFRER